MTHPRSYSICTDPVWIGRSDCKNCSIRHMMLFSELKDSDIDHILKPINNLRYAENALLYSQGDQENKVYSIRKGYIKLIQTQSNGSLRIVRLLGPGALFGIEALLDKPHRHTAISLQELDVCRINTATLKQLEREKPWLNDKILSHWEQHLSTADRWISELSSGSVRSRSLKLLTYLKEVETDRNGIETNTVRFFSHEDMASILGTSRETFSRTVSELKDKGILIQTNDKHIYQFSLPIE